MADVFISYSREDQHRAIQLAALLEQQGLSVWWDRKIPPGKSWDQIIGQALDQAGCVVVLWSKISVESDWVKEEAARGARRNALVPVIFDHVESPLGFGRIEAAEFSAWKGGIDHPEVSGFLSAVRSLVEGAGASSPPADEAPNTPSPVIPGSSRKGLVTGLGALILAIAAGVWWFAQEQSHHLEVQIWDVEGDRKTNLVASRNFSGNGDELPPPALTEEVAQWTVDEVAPDTGEGRQPVEVRLSIPADPGSSEILINSESDIPLETHLYIIRDSGKVRVKSDLNQEALALLEQDFVIEIGALGYSSVPVRVEWGKAVDKRIKLKPIRVKLAVEAFTGPENRFGMALTQALALREGLSMFGPDALERLRREIEKSRANVGVNRAAQISIRDSLGVDFIISGSYQRR